MPNNEPPRKRRRQFVPSIIIRLPRRRPHKSFRRTFQQGQAVQFSAPVELRLTRTIDADVRFLSAHELTGIESVEETPLQFTRDDTPEPPSPAGGV